MDKPKKNVGVTAQNTLQIAEIRDGIVIMEDGSYRSVVLSQSINFDLMSPQEREGVEYGHQAFLNSLHFPIQIVIRSERIDLDTYMERLEKTRINQDNVLLGLLMEDYIAYVKYLVEAANIMDKQFYVVVPYYPQIGAQEGIAANAKKIGGIFSNKKSRHITINESDFSKAKIELQQRLQMVLNGLNQMGVQSIPLNTQELLELYYSFYNPETSVHQRLTDPGNLETSIIEKGNGEAPLHFGGGLNG